MEPRAHLSSDRSASLSRLKCVEFAGQSPGAELFLQRQECRDLRRSPLSNQQCVDQYIPLRKPPKARERTSGKDQR